MTRAKKRSYISFQGRRPKEDAIYTDSTCTPLWFAERIHTERPDLALDPCSNPRSHIISQWAYSVEKGLDGLKLPWDGSVFRNNPFGWPLAWMLKGFEERSSGRCTEEIILCKLETSSEWWQSAIAPIERPDLEQCPVLWYPDLWLLDDRMEYDEHPVILQRRQEAIDNWLAGGKVGKKPPPVKTSNNFCSVVIHHRFDFPQLHFHDIASLWARVPEAS